MRRSSFTVVRARRAAPAPAPRTVELPAGFLEWQRQERVRALGAIERGRMPASFGAHLPVVATMGEGRFPVRMATKGCGLTPRDDRIEALLARTRACLQRGEGRPWKESLRARVETCRWLYDTPDAVDPRRLGMIEIFRGETYRNVLRDPRVTLLFTGAPPHYRSHQIDCLAEVIGPGDGRFEAILAMRRLFERDRFHIQQPEYPVGYLMWVQEVFEKAPRWGRAGRRLTRGRG